jgi:hypothetical protein
MESMMMCMARREDRGSVSIIYSHLGKYRARMLCDTQQKKMTLEGLGSGRQ